MGLPAGGEPEGPPAASPPTRRGQPALPSPGPGNPLAPPRGSRKGYSDLSVLLMGKPWRAIVGAAGTSLLAQLMAEPEKSQPDWGRGAHTREETFLFFSTS